ncbi:MAG: hypothetical protein NTZ74_11275 [Chloroflexi bacterium]|nr:hypothetical protein [Chloroflexota bacterium]
MAVPERVEVEFRRKPNLHERLIKLVNWGEIQVLLIEPGTPEHVLYKEYTDDISANHVAMGWGESAAIAITQVNNGILASNNLKDIRRLVAHLGIRHVMTENILTMVYSKGIKSVGQLDVIWRDMRKNCWLPTETFSEYLAGE